MGNVFEDNWIHNLEKHYDIMNATVENKEKCKKCEYKYLCLGGCPNLSYKVYDFSEWKND